MPGHRAGEHDCASGALVDHAAPGEVGGVVGPGEQDVDGVGPRLLVLAGLARYRRDAGVGDGDVDVPQLGDAFFERRLQCLPVADVGLAGDDPPPRVLDQFDGLSEVVGGGHRILDGVDLIT
jgi:hypothetical protein